MTRHIYILSIILTLVSCSSRQEKIENYGNGKVHMKYFVTSDNKKDGHYISYFDNGNKRSEGEYLQDKQEGFWTMWHDNGKKAYEGNYVDGLQTGNWKFYYNTGILQQTNNFKDGKSNGEFIDYDEKGILKRKGIAVDGLLNGKSYEYYSNGKVSSEVTYINHIPNGPFIEYFPNGQPRAKGIYAADSVIIGDYILYDSVDANYFSKTFIYKNNISSDTVRIYKNEKLKGYEIFSKDGTSREVKL